MTAQDVIALDDARPGMRLGVALADRTGQVLVPAGTELTENLLQALQRRDIAAICVEREVAEDPAAREARLAAVKAAADHLFRAAGDGMATRTLYQCIVDFRSEPRR
jgi:hypothetical protein